MDFVKRLTSLVQDPTRYDLAHSDIAEVQLRAIDERFQHSKGRIKLLAKRAGDAGIEQINSFEEAARILFPHTAYKSYPERFLMGSKWEKLSRWLATVGAD